MLVTACAGPMMQSGSAGLSGMWHGSFTHAGADYTSPSKADLTLEVRDDSTYSFKWGTRTESAGTIVDQGNRVVLNDSSARRLLSPVRARRSMASRGTRPRDEAP